MADGWLHDAIWFVGLVHIALYAIGCSIFVLTWIVWKAHSLLRLNVVILRWHADRVRAG